MKNIREAVHGVIEQRVLPWIERDGISKLVLPEQITPADCIKESRCARSYNPGNHEHSIAIGLTGRTAYCIEKKAFVFTPGRMVLLPGEGEVAHTAVQEKWWRVSSLDFNQPHLLLWMFVYPFGIRVQASRAVIEEDAVEVTMPYMLLDRSFSRLVTDLLKEVRLRPPRYAEVGRCLLMEFMQRCLRADVATPSVDIALIPPRLRGHPRNLSESGSQQGGRLSGRHSKRDKSATVASKRSVGRRKSKDHAASQSAVAARIQTAREFIHSNYHMPIGVNDIASVASLSVDHFGRLFKTDVGITPNQYLTNVRMEAARELILTDLPVSEVALMVGIEDPYYFSRVFRRANGLSPLKYRQKMAKVVDSGARQRKSAK